MYTSPAKGIIILGFYIPHYVVEYRGRHYDFGPGGVGDTTESPADPNVRENGFSYCPVEEVDTFISQGKYQASCYDAPTNNCQSFARALVRFLQSCKCPHSKTPADP